MLKVKHSSRRWPVCVRLCMMDRCVREGGRRAKVTGGGSEALTTLSLQTPFPLQLLQTKSLFGPCDSLNRNSQFSQTSLHFQSTSFMHSFTYVKIQGVPANGTNFKFL